MYSNTYFLLSSVVGALSMSSTAQAAQVDCVLEVGGRAYISGPCTFEPLSRSDGSFRVNAMDDQYFAYVYVKPDGTEEFLALQGTASAQDDYAKLRKKTGETYVKVGGTCLMYGSAYPGTIENTIGFCEDCAKFWNPNTVPADGTCPTCHRPIAGPPSDRAVSARPALALLFRPSRVHATAPFDLAATAERLEALGAVATAFGEAAQAGEADPLTLEELEVNPLILASDGRFFTLPADKLPGARGHGEPVRLMIELDDKVGIIDVFPVKPGRKRVIASKAGYGFLLPEEETISTRRAGKQVLNVDQGGALACIEANGDQVAVVGDNGKILIFPLAELPEMPRGKGVKLQTYREGGLRDLAVFNAADGATWIDTAGRVRQWAEWKEWAGRRASAGKMAPKGFPASKRFRPK